MNIRLATSADTAPIVELGRVLHAESVYRGYPLDTARVETAITEMLAQPRHAALFLACNHEGTIIGMLALRMGNLFYFDKLVAQEQMFYVHPDWRGSSAAVKLLVACRQWAINRGADEILVSVNSGVGLATLPRLMRRLHFSQVGLTFSLRLEGGKAEPKMGRES